MMALCHVVMIAAIFNLNLNGGVVDIEIMRQHMCYILLNFLTAILKQPQWQKKLAAF